MDVKTKMVERPTRTPESVVALLQNLIDYAGLFPPASLGMLPAVENYEKYLRAEFSWTLGRFIVSASRLSEFRAATDQLRNFAAENTRCWDLSALLGPDVPADFARVSEFNSRQRAGNTSPIEARIESVEVKVTSPADVKRISKIICSDMETYFEIPWAELSFTNVRECVRAVATCGRRAKVRTGGETPDKFPPAETLLELIEACTAAGVAFKATAGLHHPVRSRHRLTYQADSPSGTMHGFLNVFLGAAFVRFGMDFGVAVEVLNEQAPNAFQFDSNGANWRGRRLSADQIAKARREVSISFGSCSFTEPIDDLRLLHLL
jgi:hypothetical protein